MMLSVVGVAAAICALAFLTRPRTLSPVVIETPNPLTMKSGRFPDRWIPKTPRLNWLRALCQSVLGVPHPVKLEMTVLTQTNTMAELIAGGQLGAPTARGNGVAVWLLPATDPPAWEKRAVTAKSSMTTFNRQEIAVTFTDNQIGVTFTEEVFPRLRANGVEVWMRLLSQAGPVTNLAMRIHAQMVYGHGVLVVDDRAPAAETNRTAFLIYPVEVDANGIPVTR